MKLDEPIILDALAAIHIARGDRYGRELDARFSLSKRSYAPIISAVTAGEMMRIARRLLPREEFERAPADLVASLINQLNVAPVTGGVIRAYGNLMAGFDDDQTPLRSEFGWVAATAKVHDGTVISHSPDFERLRTRVKHVVITRDGYIV